MLRLFQNANHLRFRKTEGRKSATTLEAFALRIMQTNHATSQCGVTFAPSQVFPSRSSLKI